MSIALRLLVCLWIVGGVRYNFLTVMRAACHQAPELFPLEDDAAFQETRPQRWLFLALCAPLAVMWAAIIGPIDAILVLVHRWQHHR